MCGIVGRINGDPNRAVDSAQLAEATRLIAHRGPDGEGFYFDRNVALGHRRLSIIDLATGAQPMCNEDRSVWVTFNGEIYNHLLLREDLLARGHRFATRSDTEVLVHGYEEWGDDLPKRLRGMFAFAIWDGRNRRLLLARDRLGIKPVYIASVGTDLVFASEIKALFAFPDVRRELDAARVPEYLALRYVPGPATLFRGIERLPPGHRLIWRDGRASVSAFWDVPVDEAPDPRKVVDEIEQAEALSRLVLESTRMRLMSEVPVGIFLSGGIDSSTIAWAMEQAEPKALKSFSVGYEGDLEGELAYARLAAQALRTEHREVAVDAASFGDSVSKLAWHLDEPLADGACIPLMRLAERAREEVVVVLSGEGADEILGGYPIYTKMLAIERARAWGGPALDGLLGLAGRLPLHPKVLRYLALGSKPLERRYLGVGRAFDDALVERLFGSGAMDAVAARFEETWRRTVGAHPLNRMLYTDSKIWLPDDLLIKADKTTMAHAIELRVPFLDHELLEFAWGLPPGLKRRGRVGKHLLRVAMAGKIPEPILRRPKKGFPVPLTRWLRGALHAPCRERLLASGSAVRGLVGGAAIEKLLDEHRQGRVDRREELYALWLLEEWHAAFFARGGDRASRRPGTGRAPVASQAAQAS